MSCPFVTHLGPEEMLKDYFQHASVKAKGVEPSIFDSSVRVFVEKRQTAINIDLRARPPLSWINVCRRVQAVQEDMKSRRNKAQAKNASTM